MAKKWADLSRGVNRPERDDDHRSAWMHKHQNHDEALVGISDVAEAIERSVETVRRWERDGILPPAPFRSVSADPRGERRRYRLRMVDEVALVARRQKLGRRINIKTSDFPKAVGEVYARYAGTGQAPPGPLSTHRSEGLSA